MKLTLTCWRRSIKIYSQSDKKIEDTNYQYQEWKRRRHLISCWHLKDNKGITCITPCQ